MLFVESNENVIISDKYMPPELPHTWPKTAGARGDCDCDYEAMWQWQFYGSAKI